MNIIPLKNFTRIFVFGDIHGEFDSFFHFLKQHTKNKKKNITHPNEKYVKEYVNEIGINTNTRITDLFLNPYDRLYTEEIFNNSIIIIAGDCGIGFNKEKYYLDLFTKANSFLESNNICLCFVRGNHDNPSYFQVDKFNLSNIKFIQDYSIIQSATVNVLCIGGGISIDRSWRKQRENVINKHKPKKSWKKLYWEDENVIYDEDKMKEILDSDISIHHVISHSSPSFVFPKTKEGIAYWLMIDKKLIIDIDKERQNLTKIYEQLRSKDNSLRSWIYGHFHKNNTENFDGVSFKCLNCEFNFKEIR